MTSGEIYPDVRIGSCLKAIALMFLLIVGTRARCEPSAICFHGGLTIALTHLIVMSVNVGILQLVLNNTLVSESTAPAIDIGLGGILVYKVSIAGHNRTLFTGLDYGTVPTDAVSPSLSRKGYDA